MNVPMLTPRFEEDEPRMIPSTMKWRSIQNTTYWFDRRIAHDKRLAFYQSNNNATSAKNKMPAKSLMKMVKRNKDDSQGEILCQKEDLVREEVRHIRLRIDQRIDPIKYYNLQTENSWWKSCPPQDGQKNQPMSEDAKNIIVEQRNVEVFELMDLPDKIQCEICHKYTSVGHTQRYCGSILTSASEEVQKTKTRMPFIT